MRLKLLAYGLLGLIVVIVQSTVLDSIEINGIKPNILLTCIISVALLTNSTEGATVGFLYGLVQDLYTGKLVGYYALLGLYLGLTVSFFNKRLYRENMLIVIFITFISSIVYGIIFFFTSNIAGLNYFRYALGNIILPEAIYNSFSAIFVYIIVMNLVHRFESVKRLKRKY